MAVGNSTNDNWVCYISPTINMKTTGVTTLFEIPSTVRIYPKDLYAIIDVNTAANGDNFFNIGWTGPNYQDWVFHDVVTNLAATNIGFSTTFPGNETIDSTTPFKINVTTADTGTALSVRFIMTGSLF